MARILAGGDYEVRTGAAGKPALEAGEIILEKVPSLLKEAYAGR